MGTNKERLQATLSAIFANLSEEQVSGITKSLTSVVSLDSQDLVANVMHPEPAETTGKPSARTQKRREGKQKRVLNGFICFRSHYGSVFKGKQMDKSGLLRQMWAAEPRRNLFSLLGKAYSELRDNHAQSLSLDSFLRAVTHLLPVVPADQYLDKMGWVVFVSEGRTTIHRSKGFDATAVSFEYPPRTNLSVHDLVSHCYEQGLVDRRTRQPASKSEDLTSHQISQDAMAFATAPELQKDCADDHVRTPEDKQTDNEIGHAISTHTSPSSATSSGFDDGYLTMEAVTADQQAAYERLEFGFHFHPDMPPVLGFDPRIVQDDFDPFDLDLSSFVQFEK